MICPNKTFLLNVTAYVLPNMQHQSQTGVQNTATWHLLLDMIAVEYQNRIGMLSTHNCSLGCLVRQVSTLCNNNPDYRLTKSSFCKKYVLKYTVFDPNYCPSRWNMISNTFCFRIKPPKTQGKYGKLHFEKVLSVTGSIFHWAFWRPQ